MIKLIPLLFMIACSSVHTNTGVFNLEPTVQEHLSSYFEDKLIHTGHNIAYHDIAITFEPLRGNEIGVCEYWAGSRNLRTIKLDPSWWFNASYSMREQLVYHEMGHCDLGLDHNSDGIMRDINLGESHYVYHRESLVRELFDSFDIIGHNNHTH